MDPAERAFLNEQPLYKLLFPDPDQPGYRHYQPYIDEALAERTELTLAIGDADAMDRARDSKLWHPFQNEVGLFPDGWYQTLHMSYAGHYDEFTLETLHWITGRLPMIRHLNIMFSCVKPAIEPTGNIEQLLFLIHMYSPHLVTFRLWVSGPLYWPIRRATFCALLFGALKHIPNLATLWLDLTQLVRNDRLPDEFPPLVPLENLFQNRRLFDNLIEFRYATTSTTQFEVLSEQVAPIGNLARIYIASGSQFYEDWITIEWNTARAFREISVLLNGGIGNLRQFSTTFDALTRLNVELVQGGPRFMELFRALARVPHLQVLTVDSFQSPLFTPEDSA